MIRYGQYCPIAKSLELLAERWTLLIVRELLMGSRHFNDLRRGVPLMSPSVMSERLKKLTDSHIVVREPAPDGRSFEYRLTAAGEELRPLIMQLGTWGQRWYRSRMAKEDLDASFLMWDIRRNVHVDRLPARTVISFEYPDARKGMRHWWLVVHDGEADLCLEEPGYEVDVWLTSSLRVMTQIWMGDISFAQARTRGLLKIAGPRGLTRDIAAWLGESPFAHEAPMSVAEPRRLRDTAHAG